jgi:hypothetical protein
MSRSRTVVIDLKLFSPDGRDLGQSQGGAYAFNFLFLLILKKEMQASFKFEIVWLV